MRRSAQGSESGTGRLKQMMDVAASHDAVVAAFSKLNRRETLTTAADWRKTSNIAYPGREHMELTSYTARWIKVFRAWLDHRRVVQGYRSDDTSSVLPALNILADYLFLYLPWWAELHPTANLCLPHRPRDFLRYAFVHRTESVPPNELPTPLLEMLRKRRPKDASAASAVRVFCALFKFIGLQYMDDADIAGPEYVSPLDKEFDRPVTRCHASKSNKVVIPPNIYGHLLFYAYAVEAFGEHLVRLALDGHFNETWWVLRRSRRFTVSGQ